MRRYVRIRIPGRRPVPHPPRRGRTGAGFVVGATVFALVSGCGAASSTLPASSSPPAIPAVGSLVLTGDLKRPGPISTDQLRALPQQTITVSFGTGKGPEQHVETGVALVGLLPPEALATRTPTNDLLSFAVLVLGADGYAAAPSYGELSPKFGNHGALLALSQDGTRLDRPRLIVPGDADGGRDVTDVTELHIQRISR